MTENLPAIILIFGILMAAALGGFLGFWLGRKKAENLRSELEKTKISHAQLEAEIKHQKDQLNWSEKAEKTFQELSEKILLEQREALTEKGKETFKETLTPFQTEMEKFRDRIIKLDKDSSSQHKQLEGIIGVLKDQTGKVSDEANALTKALKGESQTRGAWGETQLQRILELSGLKEGIDYETQY